MDFKTLVFQGYSDDTFGYQEFDEDGARRGEDDYDNSASGHPIVFRVCNGSFSLDVVGQYCPAVTGGWLVGIAPTDEDVPVLDGFVAARFIKADRPYSTAILVEVPADAEIRRVSPLDES